MLRKCILLVICCIWSSSSLQAVPLLTAESEGMTYQVDEVYRGSGVIWGMAFLAPEELLFTRRDGTIGKINPAAGAVMEVRGAPQVWSRGQGGMLDVAVPDDFRRGDWIYFTYSKDQQGQGVTTLARARLEEDTLTEWQELLVTRSASNTARHFGSRIAFDGRGHLFFSIGDRGERPNGQDRSNHAGSILRLRLDGSVPADNPFVDQDGLPEIWSFGHRNPQGLFWENSKGLLWSNEHGPRGGDEINLIVKGGNYGWPVVSHGKEYWGPVSVGEDTSKPGMVDPVKVYIPSIAPGSLLVYSGKAFPQWRGDFFSTALALVHLNRVVFDDDWRPIKEERLLEEVDERLRDIVESKEGWLYLSTDSGKILRLRPVSP
jgi:aldose sugar dehydrogenase